MQDHVAAMCRSCFFQLRKLQTIRNSLTTDAAKTLAQAFVRGRLDYCNSLLYGVSGELLRHLQMFECTERGSTVHHWYSEIRSHHASVAERSLHWLPVRQRIIFKIATLMYRCLNGLAPSYLAADCIIGKSKLLLESWLNEPRPTRLHSALRASLRFAQK